MLGAGKATCFDSRRDVWYGCRMARRKPPRRESLPPFAPAAVVAAIPPTLAFGLFDHLPDTYLFVKDLHHRFVQVNLALARLEGCHDASGMLGRTDFDFHPPTLAAQYVAEDERVMTRRQPLIDQLWLVPGADGVPLWYRSTKVPLIAADDSVIGIAGVMRPAAQAGQPPEDYARIAKALDVVQRRYGERLAVSDLARVAGLSVSQLQREFLRLLAMTPSAYITKVRVLMARRALERSDSAVGSIALDLGFYDQSHFTRVFRRQTGLTPLAYRQRFRS
jgi:AraC-like DNA-binding protein